MGVQEVDEVINLQDTAANLHVVEDHLVLFHVGECVPVVIENDKKYLLGGACGGGTDLLYCYSVVPDQKCAIVELQLVQVNQKGTHIDFISCVLVHHEGAAVYAHLPRFDVVAHFQLPHELDLLKSANLVGL
jgi:hypothetical protein